MFSSLEPPTGHLLMSMLLAFLWMRYSNTLLPMSKTESIPVARRESEAEDIAAYTVGCECELKHQSESEWERGRVGGLTL